MTHPKNARPYIRFTGQHFMQDTSLIRQMITETDIKSGDLVLDIGAGKGAITEFLSSKPCSVIAVERDKTLVKYLDSTFNNRPNVNVVGADFKNMQLPKRPFKVAANIPYSITTDIFGRLMDGARTSFVQGVFILELGAAKRFIRKEQDDPRIVGWNSRYNLKMIRTVSRKAFWPPPKVTSAMLKVSRRNPMPVEPNNWLCYISFVSTYLGTPGIRIGNALNLIFTHNQVKRILQDRNLNPDRALRTLSTGDWLHCFHTMKALIPARMHPSMPRKYKKIYR